MVTPDRDQQQKDGKTDRRTEGRRKRAGKKGGRGGGEGGGRWCRRRGTNQTKPLHYTLLNLLSHQPTNPLRPKCATMTASLHQPHEQRDNNARLFKGHESQLVARKAHFPRQPLGAGSGPQGPQEGPQMTFLILLIPPSWANQVHYSGSSGMGGRGGKAG